MVTQLRLTRRMMVGTGSAALASLSAPAIAQSKPVRLGFLSDMNGPSAASNGAKSLLAARLAIDDFGGSVVGRPVELMQADHQNKPDIGVAIASKWLDVDGVDAIIDCNNSAVALAVQDVVRQRKRIFLITGASTSELDRTACSPFGVHWLTDTYTQTQAVAESVLKAGGKKWFFLVVDYSFGLTMAKDLYGAVTRRGGTVVGQVKHPFTEDDYSNYIVQAQSSDADVLAFCNSVQQFQNSLKTAKEFNVSARLVPTNAYITDVHGLGLDTAQGVKINETFYWDMDGRTRAWSERFRKIAGVPPTAINADVYHAVTHYLKAMREAGTTEAAPAMAVMKSMHITDEIGDVGIVRVDGRVVRDLYRFTVKAPAESKYPWDYYTDPQRVIAEEIYQPLSESTCPLVVHR